MSDPFEDQQLIEGKFSGPAWEAFVKRQWQAYLEREHPACAGLYEQQALRKSLQGNFCTVAAEKEYSPERHGRKGHAMIVSGEEAVGFKAVRRDSYEDANKGPLTYADDITGEVRYLDITGEEKKLVLGDHAIAIVSAKR